MITLTVYENTILKYISTSCIFDLEVTIAKLCKLKALGGNEHRINTSTQNLKRWGLVEIAANDRLSPTVFGNAVARKINLADSKNGNTRYLPECKTRLHLSAMEAIETAQSSDRPFQTRQEFICRMFPYDPGVSTTSLSGATYISRKTVLPLTKLGRSHLLWCKTKFVS